MGHHETRQRDRLRELVGEHAQPAQDALSRRLQTRQTNGDDANQLLELGPEGRYDGRRKRIAQVHGMERGHLAPPDCDHPYEGGPIGAKRRRWL